ncbi:MAG: portal protein [Candidatus Izemoplasma sp.]
MKVKGFELSDKKEKPIDPEIGQVSQELAHEVEEDNGYNIQYDSHGSSFHYIYKNQSELISKYRSLDMAHYVSDAIDDIVDDAIVLDEQGFSADVKIDIDKTQFSDNIKKLITDEWEYFTSSIYDIDARLEEDFRNWYIDGQTSCYLIPGAKGEGLKEMRKVDPLYLNKIVKKKRLGKGKISLKEMWIYDIREKLMRLQNSNATDKIDSLHYQTASTFEENISSMEGRLEIEPDAIAHANSGLRDQHGFILSYLHRAIKPYNDLKNFENSILIYIIARAPQRRIFYIDVGLNKGKKAEKYVKDLIKQHRNKMVYDENTGALNESHNIRSMLEDYWLPRQAGSRGTDVQTLDGGGSLADIEDLKYYQDLLYKALKSPKSRRMDDPQMLMIGKESETSRDEMKRAKFIKRLVRKFSTMLVHGFATHLVLKNIITEEEGVENRNQFNIVYANDNHFVEIKNNEMLLGRIEVLDAANDHIGTYFTREEIMRDVLQLNEEEIKEKIKNIEEFNKLNKDPDEENEE